MPNKTLLKQKKNTTKIGSKVRTLLCHKKYNCASQKKLCTTKKKCASQHRHKRIWRRTKKKLQNVVLNSISDKNTHLRGWLQTNFLLSDKKALLSAVVLLQNVGVYTVDKEKCGVRAEKRG